MKVKIKYVVTDCETGAEMVKDKFLIPDHLGDLTRQFLESMQKQGDANAWRELAKQLGHMADNFIPF